MSTDYVQKSHTNHYTIVKPMFVCQNGLTEDITQYAHTQVSFSDGDVPLYIVHPVSSINNLTQHALKNCQFANIKESDNFSEQSSACNESRELHSLEIGKFL